MKKKKQHNWAWACRKLLAGFKVRRSFWAISTLHIFDDHGPILWSTGEYVILQTNLMAATDWVRYSD